MKALHIFFLAGGGGGAKINRVFAQNTFENTHMYNGLIYK